MPVELHETDVIKNPVISEKSTHLAQNRNSYVFEVDKKADKAQIKAAVEKLYNVKVTAVRTVNVLGKQRRTRSGYKNVGDWKKAIVKLDENSKIDLF